MSPISSLGKLAIGVSTAAAVYAVVIGALLSPAIQKIALYAHYFNTDLIHNVNEPEQFGYGKGQVTPFHITTPDGETLYAWHVLPLDAYVQHEHELRAHALAEDSDTTFTSSLPFRLLSRQHHSGQPVRVIVNFHGNAGHVAQGWRTDTYRNLATQPNTHVISIDYRGFGRSTGSPSEAGLITDGIATIEWVLSVAQIRPEQVVILGQSLGTAVASAVALHFADPASLHGELLLNVPNSDLALPRRTSPVVFAGVVLVAPFWSLPTLLKTYRIGGLLPPLLAPLHYPPSLYTFFTDRLVDVWCSGERLSAYVNVLSNSARNSGGSRSINELLQTGYNDPDGGYSTLREIGSIQLVHAVNDADIWFDHSRLICAAVLDKQYEQRCRELAQGDVLDVKDGKRPRVRVEIVAHGGHNRIVTYTPVGAAVLRAFNGYYQ